MAGVVLATALAGCGATPAPEGPPRPTARVFRPRPPLTEGRVTTDYDAYDDKYTVYGWFVEAREVRGDVSSVKLLLSRREKGTVVSGRRTRFRLIRTAASGLRDHSEGLLVHADGEELETVDVRLTLKGAPPQVEERLSFGIRAKGVEELRAARRVVFRIGEMEADFGDALEPVIRALDETEGLDVRPR